MATLRTGDIVMVVRLNLESRGCLGRRPVPGETGSVRTVVEQDGLVTYMVERRRPDGTEEWLGDFEEADLALKSRRA
jgi:hypothetical protein